MGVRLQGRGGVVTGAGRGIGREIALALAAEGVKLLVNDPGVSRVGAGSNAAPADEVVTEIRKHGGTAMANYDSVTDFAAAERIVKSCVDNFGRIDILVNCAGVLRDRMIFNMAEEEWDMVLSVHLKGTFNMCRHASRPMREQRYGRIINVASAAWLGSTGQSNYSAAKGGIVSFTRSIARELGRYGVTCNCIVPMAATRMTLDDDVKSKFKMQLDKGEISQERYEELVNMPGPEFVAPAVVYLATDAAANINGLVVRSAGGTVGVYSEPSIVKIIHKNYRKEGSWTVDELADLVPKILLVGYVNPAPPEEKAK
jgi:NAD(P)-dependent dehydrogenase (short-subunit alcohol dehydrogenase family)